jgi:hypothetical protein
MSQSGGLGVSLPRQAARKSESMEVFYTAAGRVASYQQAVIEHNIKVLL